MERAGFLAEVKFGGIVQPPRFTALEADAAIPGLARFAQPVHGRDCDSVAGCTIDIVCVQIPAAGAAVVQRFGAEE